eukprot:m.84243 g.84243  ORF g.84243 m.84243 type:complete len:798 (+) comp25726_c0_seq1:98-2491(+)
MKCVVFLRCLVVIMSVSTFGFDGCVQGAMFQYSCRSTASKQFKFCDVSLPIETRVADLLVQLTVDEKLSLMGATDKYGNDACSFMDPGVPRLNIPPYKWCVEDNTGVSTRCLREGNCATTFPSPALLGATFNRTLWNMKGSTQGIEHRALFNLNATRGRPSSTGQWLPIGLNGWAPNINVVRDPRYGRNSELPSEDPYINGQYAIGVVRGMQEGDDPKYPLLIHSTLKHYTAYSIETNRFAVSGNVSSYDLFDSFLPQYEAGFVEGKAGGAMCSYMSMNNVPSCANDGILNKMVRETWGREDALIVTDCFAVESMVDANHYAKDVADATAKSINAGVDLNTGWPWSKYGGLKQALGNHTITLDTVNTALARSLTYRMKLGLFDDPTTQKYTQYGYESINTSTTQQLVVEAAAQGMVLLKNDGPVLPLGLARKIAVVGVHASTTTSLLSDYYGDQVCFGTPTPESTAACNARNGGSTSEICQKTLDGCVVTIGASVMDANARKGGETKVVAGVGMVTPATPSGEQLALDAVTWADEVVLAVGIDHGIEHEGIDRQNTSLPQAQIDFALKVLALGKPVVLILVNGGALSTEPLLSNAKAPNAIVETFYPNSAGAAAIGPALFGETNNWGKLPITIYPAAYNNQLTIEQVRMRADTATDYPGRGYRYYTGKPLFEFGQGLSLTTFSTTCANDSVAGDTHVVCTVTNTGNRVGDEVVMVFHRPPAAPAGQPQVPIRRLLDFDRLSDIAPGASKKCSFVIMQSVLQLVAEDDTARDFYTTTKRDVPGVHTLQVGHQSFQITV